MSNAVGKPPAAPGEICPLNRTDVSKVCHKCPLWVHVRGKHPQGEEIVDMWRCSLAWLPILLVENSQMQRQTGASTDKVASEIAKFHDGMLVANRLALEAPSVAPHAMPLLTLDRTPR